MSLINDENYKGVSLEEFVEFQIEELDLIEELVSVSYTHLTLPTTPYV